MRVLIDNAHGVDTKGKRSPNGMLKEWECTRQIAKMVFEKLTNLGIETYLLVTEDVDIPLSERVKRANRHYKEDNETILISLHLNASSNGEDWGKPSGWECIINDNASDKTKDLANCLTYSAVSKELNVRRQKKNCNYWIDNKLAILKNTKCPSVLTENLFMDNINDYHVLMQQSGKQLIANLHVDAIKNYIKKLNENEQLQ